MEKKEGRRLRYASRLLVSAADIPDMRGFL